jgi:hypothetical protein
MDQRDKNLTLRQLLSLHGIDVEKVLDTAVGEAVEVETLGVREPEVSAELQHGRLRATIDVRL